MIEIKGRSFSGSIIKNDDSELIATIFTIDTMQDLCVMLTNVDSVTETIINGEPVIYAVRDAVQITSSAKNCYTIVFTKRLSEIEEMSNAIDALLVAMLEG